MKLKDMFYNISVNYKARKLFDWYELNSLSATKYRKYRNCGKFDEVFDKWIKIMHEYRELGFELGNSAYKINIYCEGTKIYSVDDRLDRSEYFIGYINDHDKSLVRKMIVQLYDTVLELKSLINDLEVNM